MAGGIVLAENGRVGGPWDRTHQEKVIPRVRKTGVTSTFRGHPAGGPISDPFLACVLYTVPA